MITTTEAITDIDVLADLDPDIERSPCGFSPHPHKTACGRPSVLMLTAVAPDCGKRYAFTVCDHHAGPWLATCIANGPWCECPRPHPGHFYANARLLHL